VDLDIRIYIFFSTTLSKERKGLACKGNMISCLSGRYQGFGMPRILSIYIGVYMAIYFCFSFSFFFLSRARERHSLDYWAFFFLLYLFSLFVFSHNVYRVNTLE
jgi:hypothetical protein